jgi:hypothetical protein
MMAHGFLRSAIRPSSSPPPWRLACLERWLRQGGAPHALVARRLG